MKEAGLVAPISQLFAWQSLKGEAALGSITSFDGARLGFRHWAASHMAPVVVHLHGIEGHSQWFSKTAEKLNENDIAIYALDRRGSGMNRDYPGHLASFKTYLQDLEISLSYIKDVHPDQNIVLMANCWSARAAAIIASENYRPITKGTAIQLAGLVLTSPAIYTKIDLSWRTKCMIALARLKGGNNLMMNWPIPLEPEMFTNSDQYIEDIRRDSWRLKEATAGFYLATAILSWLAKQAASSIRLPLLILQAGADQIVDVAHTLDWYREVKSEEKAMYIFPKTFHSIDFDENLFDKYTDILSHWVKER